MLDLTRLFQPSGKAHLSLTVSCYPAFSYCLLAASDTLKYGHTFMH